MLEIWRGLIHVACGEDAVLPRLNLRVDIYFENAVFQPAYESNQWQSALCAGEVKSGEINDWVYQQGGRLNAGLHLMTCYYRKTWDTKDKASVLHEVLLDAVRCAVTQLDSHEKQTPGRKLWLRKEIIAVRDTIRSRGLIWDTEKDRFVHSNM